MEHGGGRRVGRLSAGVLVHKQTSGDLIYRCARVSASVSLARKGAWSRKDTQVATTMIGGMASRTLKNRTHPHQGGVATDTHDRRSNGRQTTITATAAAAAAEAAPGHPPRNQTTPDTHTARDGLVRTGRQASHYVPPPSVDIMTPCRSQTQLEVRPAIRCAVRRALYGSTRGSAEQDTSTIRMSNPFHSRAPISQPLDTWLLPPVRSAPPCIPRDQHHRGRRVPCLVYCMICSLAR